MGISFNEETNQYEVPGEKWASELTDACEELNTGWFIWQECVKAKAQAVPEDCVIAPKEPTMDMIRSACSSISYGMTNEENSKRIYKAMIEASESGAEG